MLKRSRCCHCKDELGNGVLRGGIGNRAPERGLGCPHFPFFPSFTRKDTGGEVDFRRDVLLVLSTKGGRYSPPRRKNTLFWWHLPPLFDFATSIQSDIGEFLKRV